MNIEHNATADILAGVFGFAAGGAVFAGCLACPPVAALGFAGVATISIIGGAATGAATGAIVAAAKGDDITEGAKRGAFVGGIAGFGIGLTAAGVAGISAAVGAGGNGFMGLILNGSCNHFIEAFRQSLLYPVVGSSGYGFLTGVVDGVSRGENRAQVVSRAIRYAAIGDATGAVVSGLLGFAVAGVACYNVGSLLNGLGCAIAGLIPSSIVGLVTRLGLELVNTASQSRVNR